MMVPRVQDLLERPFTRIPQRRVGRASGGFVLGLALGAVYVPCAGPVLAAITVAGATGRIGGHHRRADRGVRGRHRDPAAGVRAGRAAAWPSGCGRSATRQRGVRIVAGAVLIALAVALTFNVTDALQRAIPDYTAQPEHTRWTSTGQRLEGAERGEGDLADRLRQQPGSTTLENCGQAPGHRRHPAVAQHPGRRADQPELAQGQGRPGRLLGLLLHQLPAGHHARRGLVLHLQAADGLRGDRRAHPGVRLRARAPAT